MKVTRYPQSCLVIEDGGHVIAIDPGAPFLQSHQNEELDAVEAVLFTHKHADHMEPEIASYLSDRGVELYGNHATAEALGDINLRIVEDGEEFEAAHFRVRAHDLPHCPMPDGSEGPQNTAFVINGTFFHPGDAKSLNGMSLQVHNMALPIQGPDISFRDANDFRAEVGAKIVIPVHYDLMGAKPEVFKQFLGGDGAPFEIRILGDGESTQL